jgi:hypothetical protein
MKRRKIIYEKVEKERIDIKIFKVKNAKIES